MDMNQDGFEKDRMKIQEVQEKNSVLSTYYIKAMTMPLAKRMSAVDPYYFFVCVSFTITLHAHVCVH